MIAYLFCRGNSVVVIVAVADTAGGGLPPQSKVNYTFLQQISRNTSVPEWSATNGSRSLKS